jgi:hypothetical protein
MSKCGKPCEIYSRVCGYHRPTRNWNKGKRAEFKDRVVFAIPPPDQPNPSNLPDRKEILP